MDYDDGLAVDDTFKFSGKVFANTSGKSRIKPFGASMTVLSRRGKVVVSVCCTQKVTTRRGQFCPD
jgi:hypothetical protein